MVGLDIGSYGADRHPKDGIVSEQWRLQWGYPPFRVDRDRLIWHIFGSIARRKHRTAKITKVKIESSVLTVAPRPMVPINKNVHHGALSTSIP